MLPTQLFKKLEYKGKDVFLYEDPKFFTAFKYHKLKLTYHRSTMKWYQEYLAKKGYNVHYFEFSGVAPVGITHFIDPLDHSLEKKYRKLYPKAVMLQNQSFTLTRSEIIDNSHIFYKSGKFSHSSFYKWQRRRLDILMNGDVPRGGVWSFDADNRKKMPDSIVVPGLPRVSIAKAIGDEAKKYIDKHFPQNYGEMNLIYPITHSGAMKWLRKFVDERLTRFGDYQDASRPGEPFLFHSVLTPMLNVGLLTDWDVINEVLKKKVKISSVEGFIRQLIGWRNYTYAVYTLSPEIQRSNFFGNTGKLSSVWWTGDTGVLPLDDIIRTKILPYAYAHHIERLMYLGSYMLMSGAHPREVYRQFMEWTIDAYEWVMVPNIYGMSQYADPCMMTRPYISSSAYILRMSRYLRGDWCAKWDSLYRDFVRRHRQFFKKNYAYANIARSSK